MPTEVSSLNNQRRIIKGQLTRFENCLKAIDLDTDLDSLDIEGRLKRHLSLLDKFNDIQTEIENLSEKTPEILTANEKERDLFEKRFYSISGKAKQYLKKMQIDATTSSIESRPVANVSEREENSAQVSSFHLPKLQTPTFNGSLDTWMSFYDSFKSMCHENSSIPIIQKFHYLKACLQGEAAEVIASLATSTENYTVAWNLLKQRYNNKKFIVEAHVKALFEIPHVSREFSIQSLLDNIQKRLRALEVLDQPVRQWDTLLIFIIRQKLNNYTLEKWEEFVGSTEVPTMQDMTSFLERRALIENTYNSCKQASLKGNFSHNKANAKQNVKSFQTCMATTCASKSNKSQNLCPLCSSKHPLFTCSKFLSLTPPERYNEVKRFYICHNCFMSNHRTIDCRKNPCSKCQKRHNVLLHFDKLSLSSSGANSSHSREAEVGAGPNTDNLISVQSQKIEFQSPSQVLLGTALVNVLDKQGKFQTFRALLDGGSQCNAMTERCASLLGLHKQEFNIQLRGVENLKTDIKYSTSTLVRSRVNDVGYKLTFLVFQQISSHLPSIPFNRNSLLIPNNLILADPEFCVPSSIDLLLGAECFYKLLGSGKISLKGVSITLRETELGWIVVGSIPDLKGSNRSKHTSCNLIKYDTLPLLWEIGGENPSKKIFSGEEKECERHFVENTRRDSTGRYHVRLPFTDNKEYLGNSRNTALQRFYSLERKFIHNPELKTQYSECIQGYLDQGHMSLASNETILEGYYLPHHAVFKEESLTTKMRVVFDGSAKTSTGLSLNDTLMVGPTIQEDLWSIIIRFRLFLYALTADIQQMYRQIRVDPDDSSFQKILWRNDSKNPIQVYTLNTVTFGTASAPYLAIRTLKQLAEDESVSFPKAAAILSRDFYVDDLLTGAQTLQDALQIRDELITLLKRGGFLLRKWGSNCHDLIKGLSDEGSRSHMTLDPSETIKTLGLCWDSSTDTFRCTVNISRTQSITKRSILSQTAKLFDPLGLLGPVVIVAKILIQDIWKTKLGWDDAVPLDIQNKWLQFQSQLPSLNNLKISRCIMVADSTEIQIHGFSDASEKGYGACLYILSINKQGDYHSALICSKSRVAPIKTITLPRLELCAAVLLSRLFDSVKASLCLQFDKVFFWSDSTIVLNWINTAPHTLKTFVANRVAEIQTTTQPHQWRHVPSNQNPADYISRGQGTLEFIENTEWFCGPSWLYQDSDSWPKQSFHDQDVPERKNLTPIISLKIVVSNTNILEKYSSLHKLQRVVAYCMRFMQNVRKKDKAQRISGLLSANELDKAMEGIIKLVQAEIFYKEIKDLSQQQRVESTSNLYKLNPFLDHEIIKVGGRLQYSELCESQKHPIVLPKGHQVTKLIIRDEHIKRFHSGINATLYGVRKKYWPIDGRNTTRQIIRQCVRCFKAKPRGFDYFMSPLPKERISFAPPFTHTGLDYCGPFYIKENRVRNRGKVKTYVAVFVCFSTKAIHLELVSDLTTEAFLSSLKRFFARRGISASIHSDNATNFIGANNELKELYKQIDVNEKSEDFQNFISKQGVSWHFIPPRAPHYGGLWEAAVKSFKTHFTRIAANTLLTYEQLNTYIIEIEAILNSRPLSTISSDPNDYLPLTPGHFLIGNSMTTFPQADLRKIPANRLSCWQHAQQMKQHFWDRWQKEYLNEMICRNKWNKPVDQGSIKIGTLVIVKEDNLPPLTWKTARIAELHPGSDGIVRTVTLRTSNSTFKRSLKYLYPLPIKTTHE